MLSMDELVGEEWAEWYRFIPAQLVRNRKTAVFLPDAGRIA
jgi:hypothetical protein